MGETVVSGGDSAEVLEAAEHALDGIAFSVERGRKAGLPPAVGLGRDVRCGALGFDLSTHGVAVIGFVAQKEVAFRHELQQGLGRGAIGHLAAGQQEGDRAAVLVAERVDLGAAPASGAAYGLGALPPFPPAAQRCARTAEESISTSAGGPPAEARA